MIIASKGCCFFPTQAWYGYWSPCKSTLRSGNLGRRRSEEWGTTTTTGGTDPPHNWNVLIQKICITLSGNSHVTKSENFFFLTNGASHCLREGSATLHRNSWKGVLSVPHLHLSLLCFYRVPSHMEPVYAEPMLKRSQENLSAVVCPSLHRHYSQNVMWKGNGK